MNKNLEYKNYEFAINAVEEPHINLFGEEINVEEFDLIKVADNFFKIYQKFIKNSGDNFQSILLLNFIILETVKLLNTDTYNINQIIKIVKNHKTNLRNDDINLIKKTIIDSNIVNLYKNNKYELNNIFGYVFEKLITKKETGAYYTDLKTTGYITENTIIANIIETLRNKSADFDFKVKQVENDFSSEFIETIIKNGDSLKERFFELLNINSDKKELIEILENLKIIDISCGAGSFIFSAYYLLKEIYEKLELSVLNIFDKNLFGIDIDNEAISLLVFRIKLEQIIDKSKIEIDLSDNFIIGNCLIGNISKTNILFSNNDIDSIFEKSEKLKNIISNEGFDIVLGNPPYLEYRNVIKDYQIENFISEKCNNLYAFVLEKNFDILKENGHFGMIIPISYVSTKRMSPIRNLLIKNSKYHFCSSFADRPSCLFNGVHQKLNIVLLQKSRNCKNINHYTSSYIHWYSSEKEELFNNIKYCKNEYYNPDYLFKIGNDIEKSIISKITSKHKKPLLANISNNGKYKIWLNMRMCFWSKAFTFSQKSNEYKIFSFDNELDAYLFSAITNSNLFFFFWESISDVWHITQKDLNTIKIDFKNLDVKIKKEIKYNYKIFEKNLEKNKIEINSKQTDFEYKHKNEKILIDNFDRIVCELFDLTLEEIEYVKLYQIRYRMNGEINNYIKSFGNECN